MSRVLMCFTVRVVHTWREIRFHRSSGTSPNLHVGCLKWALVIWRCSVCSRFLWWKLGKAAPSFNLFLWFHSWICTCMSSCTTSIYINQRRVEQLSPSFSLRSDNCMNFSSSFLQKDNGEAHLKRVIVQRSLFSVQSSFSQSRFYHEYNANQLQSCPVSFLHHDQSPPYNPHWRFWLDCHRPYNRWSLIHGPSIRWFWDPLTTTLL